MGISRNKELGMRAWIEGHLDVTTASMPKVVARQWQRLLMEDELSFHRLALFGFVSRRQRDTGDSRAFPEAEFAHFLGEFRVKIQQILNGRGAMVVLPMFKRVGLQAIKRAQVAAGIVGGVK